MLILLNKAKWIFLIVFGIYALSFLVGYTAGKLDLVNFQSLKNLSYFKITSLWKYMCPEIVKLSTTIKPGKINCGINISQIKTVGVIRTLIFLNNWIVSNTTMFIR